MVIWNKKNKEDTEGGGGILEKIYGGLSFTLVAVNVVAVSDGGAFLFSLLLWFHHQSLTILETLTGSTVAARVSERSLWWPGRSTNRRSVPPTSRTGWKAHF